MKAINIRLELHPTGEHVEEVVELSAELVAKALLVIDAPEYEKRRSEVWMQGYSDWLHSVALGLPPNTPITYLHSAGKPL